MRIVLALIVVACALYAAWMGKMLYHAFQTRHDFTYTSPSTGEQERPEVVGIMQVKQLHGIHVITAIASFALFAGISIVSVVELCARRGTACGWHWMGLSLTAGAAIASLLSVGNIAWNTVGLEMLLVGQIVIATLIASVTGARLVYQQPKATKTERKETE